VHQGLCRRTARRKQNKAIFSLKDFTKIRPLPDLLNQGDGRALSKIATLTAKDGVSEPNTPSICKFT